MWASRWLIAVMATIAMMWGQSVEDPQSALHQAMEWIQTGRIADARGLLEKLEIAQPDNGEALYRLGVLDLRDGDRATASRRLERAAELMPASPLPWLAVARVRLETGRREHALDAARKADQLAPSHPAVGRALAMFYAQAAEFQQAAEFELRWVAANPNDESSRLRAMEFLARAGQAEKAIAIGREARVPTADLHAALGRSHRMAGDSAAAGESFQAAIQADPEKPEYYAALAALFLDHRTPEPALAILDQAVKKFPANQEILRLQGLALYGLGRNPQAIDVFIRMAKLDPDSEIPFASMETLLPDATGRLPEIIGLLRSYCDRHQSAIGLHLLAVAVSLESPESSEPEGLLRKSISVRPDYWPAHYALHEILFDEQKWNEAASELEKTVELNPEHGAAHFRLAQVYARLGDRERAAAERRKHNQIAERIRAATGERRETMPRLSYEVAAPAEKSPNP
jgi:tetratricopeptide (TPR) repeat protein